MLFLRIDDEDRIGTPAEVADATEVALELFELTSQHQRLFFRQRVETRPVRDCLELGELAHASGDRLEVRQHATEPSFVDIWHATGVGELGDGVFESAFSCPTNKTLPPSATRSRT